LRFTGHVREIKHIITPVVFLYAKKIKRGIQNVAKGIINHNPFIQFNNPIMIKPKVRINEP
jgi:hypothetical protein